MKIAQTVICIIIVVTCTLFFRILWNAHDETLNTSRVFASLFFELGLFGLLAFFRTLED